MSYRSHADLGGVPDERPVVAEPAEPLFHAAWEPKVLAMVVAMGAAGLWNIDKSRSVRETLPNYTELTYYEIWLAALEQLLLECGAITTEESREGRMLQPPAGHQRPLDAAAMRVALRRGSPSAREARQAARFAPGQRVRTISQAAEHHTRLPAYARGKHGVVEKLHGVHVFPDSRARGNGESPQWLYTVRFTAGELWGSAALDDGSVSIDAWEPYLEAVE